MVVHRHGALRTRYVESGDGVSQQLMPEAEVPIRRFDLSRKRARRAEAVIALIEQEMAFQFDLQQTAPLRAALIRISAKEHVLVVTTHHIAADCWSMGLPFQALLDEDDPWHCGVFFQDLLDFYEWAGNFGAPGNSASDFALAGSNLADIFVDQAAGTGSVGMLDLAAARKFWHHYLSGAPHAIPLPVDDNQPERAFLDGRRMEFAVPANCFTKLQARSREFRTTHFTILFEHFCQAVKQWTGESDFLVGVPVSNRGVRGSERLIGHIGNTLALRARFREEESRAQLTRRLHQEIQQALAFQYYPFELLRDELLDPAQEPQSPLIQVRFVFQNMPDARPRNSSLILKPVQFDRGVSKYDLSLVIASHGNKLRGWCEFKSPQFSTASINGFVKQFLSNLN